ncbi:hypothetical protein BDW22DRAFT_464705 [Trametopsis cervina]|nr:hypothetical protein BDW22DRAFT_464705 [Trametopsis cervina]
MPLSGISTVQPFPDLPTELVLHILTYACHTSHKTALNISVVSTWVRSTVLPYVFSTVVRRAGPAPPSSSGWTTPQGIRPSALSGQRTYSHLLPPTTHDVGSYVKHLWIESIDVMSSPGELSVFNLCTNIEDVALTASSLRMLYNSTLFGKRSYIPGISKSKHQKRSDSDDTDVRDEETSSGSPSDTGSSTTQATIGAASRIREITLTKHTFRYDWHFLVDLSANSETHTSLLGNITHLRLTSLEKSPYVPVEYMPNLTHLALPYLQLRANRNGDILRIPDIVLNPLWPKVQSRHIALPAGAVATSQYPSEEVVRSQLKMIVLTVDEDAWISQPWRHGAHSKEDSPRSSFNALRDHARTRDERVRVVLSPRIRMDVCGEWAGAARGNTDSLWEVAEKTYNKVDYADTLPVKFPRVSA